MADASDDKKAAASAVLEATLLATPGSSGGGQPVQADASALDVNSSDRYALGDVHASGGLGRVVRARDRRLHRTVAVKELLQPTPAAEARFIREALITAQLEHPGIVPVHDAGRWPSGAPYYSMKLVSGRTLRDLIQARKGLDERLALVPNAIAVAEAIAYAHSREVIHRDIKPPNVLVGDFGETLVIDWGLAKDLSGRVAEPEVEAVAAAASSGSGSGSGHLATEAGNVMGTPAYMAPEQARGEEVDARADVYALGAILYELLTGQPPHGGASVQDVLASAQKGQVVPVEERQADAPPDLCAIVKKAMAVAPADRYPTAMEMAADLRRFQTGQLVTARHYSTPALVRRWVARHRAIVIVVALAAVALAGVGVAAVSRVMAQRNRAETEMHAAQAARDELIFRQAESLLERDPTAALAVLKGYPIGGERASRLGAMIDDAVAAGVARHVLRHPDWVERLAFTGDGRLLTYDGAGNLVSWDVETGRGRLVAGHPGEQEAELTPDGMYLLIGRPDGTIEIQPTSGGASRRLRAGLSGLVRPFVSRDGRRVMTRDDQRIRLWDIASGAQLLALDHEEGQFANLSADGALLYVARESGEIVEYRVGDDRPPRVVVQLAEPAVRLVVTPNGKQLIIEDTAGELELVNLASGKARLLGRHRIGPSGMVSFSHRQDRVALTLADSTIALYRLPAGDDERLLRGHTDPAYRALFSSDDQLLYSSSDDGTVRIWNLTSGEGQVLRGHTDDVIPIAISPDGRWLASASLDGTSRIWPLAGGVARVLLGHVVDPVQIGFAAGGTRLLSGNGKGDGESHDLASGTSFQFRFEAARHADAEVGDLVVIGIDGQGRAELRDTRTGEVRLLPQESAEPVIAVAISKDDARAVTIDRSHAVRLWNLANGEARPVAVEGEPKDAAFLPGRPEVLLAGVGFLELWDLEHGRLVERAAMPALLQAHAPDYIHVSSDGRVIAVRHLVAGTLVVWNTAGREVQAIDCGAHVTNIALSPDGTWVALALGERKIKLWQPATGAMRVLSGHTDLVFQAIFSPDGRTLASCSYDRTVRLWRLDSGSSRVLRGHGSEVTALAFTPDGATLASIGGDGTVRLWPLAALSDDRPSAVPARLSAATTAVVDREGRVETRSR